MSLNKFARLEHLRKKLDECRKVKGANGSAIRKNIIDFLREQIDEELTRLQRKGDAGIIDMDTTEYGENEE